MKTKMEGKTESMDKGGVVVALMLIVVAIIALWDTTHMVDPDSFIFPRAVAVSLIGFSTLFILIQIIAPYTGTNDEEGLTGGSNLRRIGLVTMMVMSSALMPWLGFLISGVVAFIAIMLFAMYDEWTPRLKLVFPLVGVAIVTGFYFLFAELLLVPLPVGAIFE